MKKFLILAGGWIIMVTGALISPLPVPLPFPVGITLFLIGFTILTTHSKPFRRGVQYIRHHNAWLSRALEVVTHRAPERIKAMVHRTRPHAHSRRARMRARGIDDAV